MPRLPLPTFGPAHIVLAVALLLLTLFAYSALQTTRSSFRIEQQRRDLQLEVQRLRGQRAQLEGLKAYVRSDEYIESVARDEFGLVRPGETAVTVEAPLSNQPSRHPGQRWWEALFEPGNASARAAELP